MQRIVLFLFTALVVLAPLPLASNRPLPALALATGLGLVLLLWSVAALRDGGLVSIPPRRSLWLAAPFLLYLIWAWLLTLPGFGPPHPLWLEAEAALRTPLAARAALSPSAAGATLVNVMGYGAAFWLALHLGRRSRDARLMLSAIAVAMVVYALYGLAMHLGGFDMVLWYERWAYRDSVTSTFVNRNNYATYAGLGLILVLALFVERIHGAARRAVGGLRSALVGVIDDTGAALWLLIAAIVVIASALVLTGSRGGVAAAVIGVIALFASFGIARGTRAKFWFIALLPVLALGVAVVAFSGDHLLARFVDIEENTASRIAIQKLAVQQILERPWFGHGPGSFPSVFELARSPLFDDFNVSFQRVHNTYLEVALESGLPGLALLLIAVAGACLLCLRGVFRRRNAYVFPAIALAATALVGAHSLVDFGLQIPAIAVTYFTLLGIGVAQSWRRDEIEGPGHEAQGGEDS